MESEPRQKKLEEIFKLGVLSQAIKYFIDLGLDLHQRSLDYLNTIKKKAEVGADDLMPLYVEYVEKTYNFSRVNIKKLHRLSTYLKDLDLHVANAQKAALPYERSETGFQSFKEEYLCVTAIAALRIVVEEKKAELELEKLKSISRQYQLHLQKICKENPKNNLIQHKLKIIDDARQLLLSEKIALNDKKIEAFYKHIDDKKDVLKKSQDSQTIMFFKLIAVLFAGVLGLGFGGIYAYKFFFQESIHAETLQAQLQDRKTDIALDLKLSEPRIKKQKDFLALIIRVS